MLLEGTKEAIFIKGSNFQEIWKNRYYSFWKQLNNKSMLGGLAIAQAAIVLVIDRN